METSPTHTWGYMLATGRLDTTPGAGIRLWSTSSSSVRVVPKRSREARLGAISMRHQSRYGSSEQPTPLEFAHQQLRAFCHQVPNGNQG